MFDAPVDASGDRERRPCASDEQMVRELVTRLSRQDRRGASVIERAAILAEGADTESIVTWILDHGGRMTPSRRGDTSSRRACWADPGSSGTTGSLPLTDTGFS
jgi:hypothetical protein